jgi:hypothetical protein
MAALPLPLTIAPDGGLIARRTGRPVTVGLSSC